MVRRMARPTPVTDETIDFKGIIEVGPGGNYLTQPKTTKLCRKELFIPKLMTRQNLETWESHGSQDVNARAKDLLAHRLGSWKEPDLPPSLKSDIIKKARELSRGAPLKGAA